MKCTVCAVLGIAAAMVLATSFAVVGDAGPKKMNLLLYQKDPDTWDVVEGGAWGSLRFATSGEEFEFKFNGHDYDSEDGMGLIPDVYYTLIYFPDPWPGEGLIKLGEGMSHLCYLNYPYVMIQIVGSCDTGDLPKEFDDGDGAKIWLVLSDDLGDDCMTGWNPTCYLFESKLIQFEDTDDP